LYTVEIKGWGIILHDQMTVLQILKIRSGPLIDTGVMGRETGKFRIGSAYPKETGGIAFDTIPCLFYCYDIIGYGCQRLRHGGIWPERGKRMYGYHQDARNRLLIRGR
jgi:hypothetical protein